MLRYRWSIIFTCSCFFVTLQRPSNAWHLRMDNLVTANGRGSSEPPSNPYPRRLLKELTVEKCNRSLRDWIKDNGGDVSGCEVKDAYPGCKGKGWGLVACKGVKAGEFLARIPFKCCLEERETGRKGKNDNSNNHRITSFQNGVCAENPPLGVSGEVTSEIKLALRLLTERVWHFDAQSRLSTSSREGGMNWGPALDALPNAVPGCPVFFNQTMVAALQDQAVKEEVRRISSAILRTARGLSHLPGTPDDMFYGVRVDQDAMAWAWAIVASRATTVNGKLMLVPLLDMVNHNFEANVEIVASLSPSAASPYGSESGGGVELRAIKSISNGEPLEMQYGPMTNDGLLVKYGFIDPVNPYDVCVFKFGSTKLHTARSIIGIQGEVFGDSSVLTDAKDWTEIAPWQLMKLQELGLAGLGEAFHVNLLCSLGRTPLTPVIDPRLIGALRILYAVNESELKGKNTSELCDKLLYVSPRNEELVLMTLIGLCAVILRSFPTSSVSDELNLAGGGVGSSSRGAVEQLLEVGTTTTNNQQESTTGGVAIDAESAKWIMFWRNQSTIVPLYNDHHPSPSSSVATFASRWEGDESSLSNRDAYNILRYRIGKKNILNNVIKDLSSKLFTIHGANDNQQSDDMKEEPPKREEDIARPKSEAPTLGSTIQLGGGSNNAQDGDSDPFWFE